MTIGEDLKKEYFQGFLNNDGNIEAIGDYADEKEEFSYTNSSKVKLFITNLDITIEDNAKLKYDKYGSDIKIINGLKIFYTVNGNKKYIVGDDLPIKTNKDWFHYSCDVEQKNFNNNHSFLKVSFRFCKINDTRFVLAKGQTIGIELNDDFSRLENQTFHIEGFHLKV